MKYIFDKEVNEEMLARIDSLSNESQAKWGKMNAAQVLAHCNVAYEMALTEKYPKAKGLKRWLRSKTVINIVVLRVGKAMIVIAVHDLCNLVIWVNIKVSNRGVLCI